MKPENRWSLWAFDEEPEEMSRGDKYDNDEPDREYERQVEKDWEIFQPEPDNEENSAYS